MNVKTEKALKEWVSLGFISADQAKIIREHESSKSENSWILSGLLILGAGIVGIGVISLIAANWNKIPDALKLAADFSLLIGLAIWIVKLKESKKDIQLEVLLFFFQVMCLASIGLISQVFHTSGKLYQALLFWSLTTIGVTVSSRQRFIPFVWMGVFLASLVFAALDTVTLRAIFRQNIYAVVMTVPILCGGITVLIRNFLRENGITQAGRSWTLIGGLVGLWAVEMQGLTLLRSENEIITFVPGYFFTALTLLGILQTNEYRRIQKIILLLALGSYLIPFHLRLLEVRSSIFYASFTIIVLGLMAFFLASLRDRRSFQWILSLLGLRFLGLYFQALGGLAVTGFGLIVSGGLVIGMAAFWSKHRLAITDRVEGWMR